VFWAQKALADQSRTAHRLQLVGEPDFADVRSMCRIARPNRARA